MSELSIGTILVHRGFTIEGFSGEGASRRSAHRAYKMAVFRAVGGCVGKKPQEFGWQNDEPCKFTDVTPVLIAQIDHWLSEPNPPRPAP